MEPEESQLKRRKITHLKTNQMSKFFDKDFETANTKINKWGYIKLKRN